MVEHANHPDLHWLRPEGPGGQVVIGGPDAKFRGVRDLIAELALLPVEGGARIAIVERADRMNEDAQSALLKTLEEPPPGVTIVLCADEEDRLLPTVRSRCARIRLGPVGARAVEQILTEHGVADSSTAARLGRLAGGRPGIAMAYARAPDALLVRAELARALLDLLEARPSARLEALRTLVPRSTDFVAALDAGLTERPAGTHDGAAAGRARRGRKSAAAIAGSGRFATVAGPVPDEAEASTDPDDEPVRRVPATERRRGAAALIGIWLDLARDLALVAAGELGALRDPTLLEELEPAAAALGVGEPGAFLARLATAAERLDSNVAPELLLDSLVLAWPRRTRVA
jgi:hypothetical protein